MEKSTLSIKETLSITFRTLKILFHAAPGGIAFLGILSTIAGVCPFLTLILSRAFLDSLARACGQQAFEMEIIWLLFFLFLTNMMLSVVNNLSILLKSDVSGRISLLVNAQVLEKCVHLPMSQYDNETTYNRIRFTSEQTSIRCTNLINTFFSIVQCLISFASVVCVLVSFNGIIVIASVVASIPLFFVNKYVSSFWYKISVGRVEKQRYSDVLRDLMLRNDNIKELKLFGSLSYLKSRILNQQTDFFREDQMNRKKFCKIDTAQKAANDFVILLLMPTYYWSRLCALNITPQFCVELVAWVIVALAVAAGLGWMALHRPDAGKQRSARKAHAVLRRREKSAARQGMHRASTFSAALYALRCTRLPGMLALFGLLCMAFALGVSESRIVDATWADGRRVGIFPGGSLPVGSAADAALGTVLSVGILAWIAVILVAVMAFHQNKTAGAARLAVAYGVSRVRYMVGSFAAETIMLQGWYMVLYFLLSVVTGSLSQPGRTAFFWMQSAWILQASYAAVWLVCRLCGSELAGATFCFVVTLAGVIVSVSAPDPAAVSPLSALLFYATPMPYWLALGGGHSIPWQAVGYGAGVTALCLAAALAITTVRDVE